MRVCQVCGCASWGPIGNLAEIQRMTEFQVDLPAEAFVRCDNCKSIARADLLQDAEFKPGVVSPPSPGLPDFMTDMLAKVMPVVPAPPTRLERLTVALLRSGMFGAVDYRALAEMQKRPGETSVVIAIARDLERQLDEPIATAKQPWLTLSFPAREEFERWVTGFLDAMLCPGAVEGGYSEKFYEAAVAYATKQS